MDFMKFHNNLPLSTMIIMILLKSTSSCITRIYIMSSGILPALINFVNVLDKFSVSDWYFKAYQVNYREDITSWREDKDFIFKWRQQYFPHSLHSFVIYCFHHKKIKFISLSHRVIFFLLYRFNTKSGNDVIDIFSSEDMENTVYWLFSC